MKPKEVCLQFEFGGQLITVDLVVSYTSNIYGPAYPLILKTMTVIKKKLYVQNTLRRTSYKMSKDREGIKG